MMKTLVPNNNIRNIAIIAHVDHGKTTLVDAMFKQSGLFRQNQEVDDRIMDSMDLERERGITISAKNCSVLWKDVKINIIDTPGHADFGGEVERALSMADGAILLVDASEGPLPQTRFVLKKTFEAGLHVIVVINKIDRKDARPYEVLDEIYDLFIDLDATEEQLDFTVLYANGREGIVMKKLEDKTDNLHVLLESILEEIPPPTYDPKAPLQMLVSDLGYSDYLGRLAIGRIFNGIAKFNDQLICINEENEYLSLKVSKLQTYDGMKFKTIEEAGPGEIIILSGIENTTIGDTICKKDYPKPLKRITVDEPTVSMHFTINNSPFFGKEGKFVTSRHLRDRLYQETERNLALRVEDTDSPDRLNVFGRGILHLSILIETMRREGYELQLGQPRVVIKEVDGFKHEPVELLYINVDEEFSGKVIEIVTGRKGDILNIEKKDDRVNLEFKITARGLIGLRQPILTSTEGNAVISHRFSRLSRPSRLAGLSGYLPIA